MRRRRRPWGRGGDYTHVDDVGHVLAVRVLAKIRRGADHDIKAITSRLHGQTGVVHVAANMSQDLGLEAELADSLAVLSRLLRGGGGRELDVVDTEIIESLGDLDLGLGIEEGVGKLLALAERGLDWR